MIINRFAIWFTFLILSMMFASCLKDEWYDVKSDKNQSVPTTLKDFRALLDNADLFNTHSPIMGEIGASEFYYAPEVEARIFGFERNAYTWSKESSNLGVPDWSDFQYGNSRKIYVSNLVLEGVEKLSPSNKEEELEKRMIKGAALFYRAISFYEFSQQYAPPYDPSIKDLKLGIPLRTSSDFNVESIRSTIQETYDRIINDLNTSIELLPDIAVVKTRPSKVASRALLARVFLSMRNYSEALKYANEALNSYNSLIDYNTLIFSGTSSPFKPYNEETIFYMNFSGGSYFYAAYAFIRKEFYDSYNDSDLRKKAFFRVNATTKNISIRGTLAGSRGFNFFSGLATDELYLIRSECLARENKVSDALDALNYLLRRRWGSDYVDLTSNNSEEALNLILSERRKELVFRNLRWSDLRRLNKESQFAQTLSKTVGGKIYTLEPNSYKYTFPIPDDVIQISGMQQNPGW